MAFVAFSSTAVLRFGGTNSNAHSALARRWVRVGLWPPRRRDWPGRARAVCDLGGMKPPSGDIMSGRVGDDVFEITGAVAFIGDEDMRSFVSFVKTVCLMMLATRVRVMVFTNASRRFKPCGVGLSSSQSSGPRTFSNAPAAHTWSGMERCEDFSRGWR